jgi:hypothetical protein
LQPADDVWCHYFVYPDRAEDAVLDRLVEKLSRGDGSIRPACSAKPAYGA